MGTGSASTTEQAEKCAAITALQNWNSIYTNTTSP